MSSFKKAIRSVPLIGDALAAVKGKLKPTPKFETSGQYWEDRYKLGGNSGAGSYNRLAQFKAEVINAFVHEHNIKTVLEFGVGDGAQLKLASYPSYIGYDVSRTILAKCQKMFQGDATKSFYLVPNAGRHQAELVMSLDVIYHLIEDETFDAYMREMFNSSTKFVMFYASNKDEAWSANHVRHRTFSKWIEKNEPTWKLIETIPNRYPYDPTDPNHTSFADFYIFGH